MNGTRLGIIFALALVVAVTLGLAWRGGGPLPATASAPAENQGRATPWTHGLRLVVFTEEGCPWCKRFHEEVGRIYPNTEEGKAAPLWEVDIHAPRPAELRHVGEVIYTPTFVLIDERGKIVGRIEGYPGFDFFWLRLDELLKKVRARQAQTNETTKREAAGG